MKNLTITSPKPVALYRTSDGHSEVFTDLYPRKVFWDQYEHYKPVGTDDYFNVLILAGDMFKLVRTALAKMVFAKMLESFDAIVYVPGNHEYYGSTFDDKLKKAKASLSTVPNLYFLDNESLVIKTPKGEIAIIGSTLWADLSNESEAEYVSRYLGQGVFQFKDFKVIRTLAGKGRGRIKPCDLTIQHRKSTQYIFSEIERHKLEDRMVVVATHHSPSLKSASHFVANTPEVNKDVIRKLNQRGIVPQFSGIDGEHGFNAVYLKKGSRLYANDLDALILEYKPDYWVHGHIHQKIHYRVGDTDISSDPQGYLDRKNGLISKKNNLKPFYLG